MLKRVTRALTRLRSKDHWWCHAHVHMDLISKSSFLGHYGGPGYACYFLRQVKSLFLFFIFIVTPGWIPFAQSGTVSVHHGDHFYWPWQHKQRRREKNKSEEGGETLVPKETGAAS